ncbi:MAG: 4-(cytidine 5'-diphospho)-2-C-methyl-D-erythritol kinase [Hyphomicrobiaceae bacterium]
MLEEFAPAKVNLTLVVHGCRPDGYHELDSLVVFASVGDHLTFEPGGPLALTTSGAYATAITDENLVLKAVRRAAALSPHLDVGQFTLAKQLPVAAGLGGGSADAAAALRLLRRANPEAAARIDWKAVAAACGADVPVCLAGKAARMQGVGETVTPLVSLPPLACVIANPRVALSTADVFRALRAPPVGAGLPVSFPHRFRSSTDLVAFVRSGRNDLEPPAMALCPVIGDVLQALSACGDCLVARMSGSGPSCFAVFSSGASADRAAMALRQQHPDWWIAATTLA